ncbi:MAG: helicase-exonuclease AddAB subunit AddA [Lachnospiraceae bacterium]|nr:helicase-exonuclease AddAB subunit AddA [Lachnospiraceae bacterium]
MSEVKWTDSQIKAIELRNRNILVSAAAGSGKTGVLVERVIRLITDEEYPIDIDRLLVVTFTKAAATEMKMKISRALEARLEVEPENQHLQKQILLLSHAQIMTIDSFCNYLVKNYFNMIELDPAVRVGDETELKMLRKDVVSKVLEDSYEELNEELTYVIELFSNDRTDKAFEEMILKLYDKSQCSPHPKKWLEQQKNVYAIDDVDEAINHPVVKYVVKKVKSILDSAYEIYKEMYKVCCELDGPEHYLEAIEPELEVFKTVSEMDDYRQIHEVLKMPFFAKRLPSKRNFDGDPDKLAWVKESRNKIKGQVEKIRTDFIGKSPEDVLREVKALKPMIDAFVDITLKFGNAYMDAKQERKIFEFSDIAHYAVDILITEDENGNEVLSSVAKELQEYYEEILIDEYQDSDDVQESILNSVSRESIGKPNTFMVGDVKQSIYGFRQARPELFTEKYESYTVEDSDYQKVELRKNFRSRREVLDFANSVFLANMTSDFGGVKYNEDVALHVGREYEKGISDCNTECYIVDDSKKSTEIEGENGVLRMEVDPPKVCEARLVSQKIRELIESKFQVPEDETTRDITYRDIVIILRSPTGWTDIFVQELTAAGIPAIANVSGGFFAAKEIQIMLNLLLAIDNPRQDIPLTSVLASSIGDFSNEELAQIVVRCEERHLCMWEKLKNYVEIMQDDLSEKITRFIKRIEDYRKRALYSEVYNLLLYIYEDSGFEDYVRVLPGGDVRCGNLEILLQKAREFEKTSYSGLFQFNRYIQKMQELDIDFGESVGSSTQNAVQIMSIHKSKGLEFPVVFLSGMGKMFNKQDSRDAVAIHYEAGVGMDVFWKKNRIVEKSIFKKGIQQFIEEDALGEELRVYYVAMTRARDKMILTGVVKNFEKKKASWLNSTLSYNEKLAAEYPLDWVMPVMLKEYPNQIHILDRDELVENVEQEQISREELIEELKEKYSSYRPEEEKLKRMKERLEYQYHFGKELEIKSKFSVSELKHQAMEENDELTEKLVLPEEAEEAYVPQFDKTKTSVSGAERGTVYHGVMEHFPFEEENVALDVFLKSLVEKGYFTAGEIRLVEPGKIREFLKSDLAKRMQVAAKQKKLFKEQPFVLGIPATEIYPEIDTEETLMVQGIIDAYFEEEDKLFIMDYKTDRVEDEKVLVGRYKKQLELYKRALEQIMGKEVSQVSMYSFGLGKEVVINSNGNRR